MTLYASDINRATIKTAFTYLWISLFCILFGAVYESFSHEVYSNYMVYAFVFPLAGGTLPFFIISLFYPQKQPGVFARNVYHSGIATLTIGSIMRGVLDIYGTTNHLLGLYWIVGIALTAIGIAAYFIKVEIIA